MSLETLHTKKSNELPWWTWVVPPLLFYLGSEVSTLLKYDQGVVKYYVPSALSVILINWWGPWRVLPALFINAIISAYMWQISRIYLWPIYALPETLFTFLSWLFFTKLSQGKYWLPNVQETLLFILLGIVFPIIPAILLMGGLQVYFGDQQPEAFWVNAFYNGLSAFISNFGLILPVLYYFTPIMRKKKWLIPLPEKIHPFPFVIEKINRIEVSLIYISLTIFSFTINFDNYWFIYGIFSLYVAIRYGFGLALITNIFIFLLTYIRPALTNSFYEFSQVEISTIFVGTSLLSVFAALTGRVINDLKISEIKLNHQFNELELTNRELDRFVYSVSHDLSAPLKSILGLVNIGRLTQNSDEQRIYLSKIEGSVLKLESFIKEVLDYSQSKRLNIVREQIVLKDLCSEIIENVKYSDESHALEIDMQDLSNEEIFHDKMRLKIILNNIITNAIKYQKQIPDHLPKIKISSQSKPHGMLIKIEDNGEGIHPDVQGKIFNMFFRGNQSSRGSGLGLYIAKEAAEKINGSISVKSEFGKGSTFTITLTDLENN